MDQLMQRLSDRLLALDVVVRAMMLTHPDRDELAQTLAGGLQQLSAERAVLEPDSGVAEQSARVEALAYEYLDDLVPASSPYRHDA